MRRDKALSSPAPESGPGFLKLPDLQNLFTEVRSDLLRFLRKRTGNADTAADLTHDVFVKLDTVRAAIPDRSQGRAYLFRMAGNLAIDHGRIEARRAEILTGSQVLFEDMDQSPDDIAVTRDQLRAVELALDELPSKCRDVLILARMYGFSHNEIAQRLEISVSLVEKYQLRALRHCRERLGDSH
jgi:RNA polymerase sigma factor (sigma-70 family)